jgi:hypothetical protein
MSIRGSRSWTERELVSASSSRYVRWSGLACMLGGVLLSGLFAVILFAPGYIGVPFVVLFIYVWASLLAGLFGLHALQKGHYGATKWLAWAGLVLAMLGPLQSVFLGLLPFLTMGFGLVIMGITTALLVMGFGLALMGIAAIKANMLRWKALPLLMGILGIAVWFVYEAAMQPGSDDSWLWNVGVQALVTFFGAGWVSLGYILWSGKGLPAPRD